MANQDELVKELGKKIADEVKKAKESGKQDDALTKEKIEAMVKAQLEAAGVSSRKGDFDVGDNDDDDEDVKGIKTVARQGINKVLMNEKTLRRYHRDDVVQKIIDFQNLNDDVYIVGKMLAFKNGERYAETVRRTKVFQNLQQRLKSDDELRKALATGQSSYGAEWIPTGFSNQLLEAIRLQLKVEAMFPSINMPTNPYTMPIQSAKATGYLIPESTADDSTKVKATSAQTGNFTFNAKKFGARMVWSDEMDEDSIVNVLDFTKAELSTAIAEAREKAILNGDDSATHQDSNVTSSYDAQKAFDGLRYFGLNCSTTAKYSFSGGAPTTAKLRAMRKLAGKYGVNPTNNFWVVSPNGYIEMLSIDEVLTADKLPDKFTVMNGVLMSFDGSPVIVSEFMYDNLNASGVYDGSTTNLTSILYAYKPGFWVGNRLAVTLKVKEDPETDQIILIGKVRMAFQDPYDATTEPMVINGYNVST